MNETRTAPWTLDQRLEMARRHMMQAARTADIRGLSETHKAILMSVTALDDAAEAATRMEAAR